MKWTKKRAPDNRQRPMDVYVFGQYEVALNINRGDHWAYEVLHAGRYIGEARELEDAKRIAKKHYVESCDE